MKRAVLLVVVGMTAAGAVVGAAWAWLAPPVHGAVALTRSGQRLYVYLGNEADHFFASAVMMAGLLVSLAVIAAVLVWQFRQRRGPAMVAALTVGGLAAAGAATGVGAALARLRFGAVNVDGAPVSPEHRVHYVTEASTVFFGQGWLQASATLLMPAVVAALTYAALAAGAADDDLGVGAPSVPETAR